VKFPLVILLVSMSSACSSGSAESGPVDAEAIMRHAEKIVSFGPHPPGSPAQRKVGDYLIEQLESYGLKAQTQEFEAVTPRGRLPMRNVWGVLPGKTDQILILASHYDSKYFEEFEFVGANDGASSTAVVLELARILALDNPTGYTLWFVFFDGEEAIEEWSDLDSLYGSRQFVRMLKSQKRLDRIGAMVLLDLIGEKDLLFRRDARSTPWLVDIIWDTAREQGVGQHFSDRYISTLDDHIPFLEEGVPAVDIIDLDYAYWHTAEDTLDKLSPENMKMVAQVVLGALPKIANRLDQKN
jgi:glutaminyl-peptide cyclotransferase